MWKGAIMTIELFIFMLTIGGAASSLLTQALKKAFNNLSSNFLALVSAIFIGVFGMAIAFMLMDIAFSLKNAICIPLMAVCIWIGCMCGYDKVIQMISQIKRG